MSIYNLQPYNSSIDTVSRNRRVVFLGELNGITGSILIVARRVTFSGALDGLSNTVNLFVRKMTFSGNLWSDAKIMLMIYRKVTFVNSLLGQSSLNYIKTPKRTFAGELIAEVKLNKIQDRAATFSGNLNGQHAIVFTSFRNPIFFGSLQAFIDVADFIVEEVVVDVVIPPGSKLVIDTGKYTAFLDNVNVVDKYNGGWPWLSPDLVSIQVETAEGANITGEIFYREYYL